MSRGKLAQVGDVITSPKFALGYYMEEDRALIAVDGTTKHYHVEHDLDEEERVALAAKTGSVPPKTRTVDHGAYDLSRATARFVVEAANNQGGGMDRSSVVSDGWHVRARRLSGDGSYDPKGEVICFYQTGGFTNKVEPEDVVVVSTMQMRFV